MFNFRMFFLELVVLVGVLCCLCVGVLFFVKFFDIKDFDVVVNFNWVLFVWEFVIWLFLFEFLFFLFFVLREFVDMMIDCFWVVLDMIEYWLLLDDL